MKYKTDKWFTSPWNFDENVTKDFNFAKKIKLHDVSLRDGEQQAGLIFNKDQKVALAEKMAEVGIHRIEAGMPAVSAQDEAAIREIVKRNLGPEIFAFARCVKDDVKRAADCGVKGIIVEIPSSDHMIEKAYQWSLEKATQLSIEATSLAKELGLYTVFFPIDMSRADMNWVLTLIEKVATEGHMDALAIVDTFGGLAPSAVPNLVRTVKARINKPVEVHFHDDFGMGAANTVMALAAGADVAHTTVMGIGERAGNASYEEVALTLLTMYGVDLGLNYNKIYDLAKLLRDISGLPTRPNQGIFGDNIFDIESGIVAGWYENVKDTYPLELSPYLPELTGHKRAPSLVLGKHSGLPGISDWLKKLGMTATEDQKRDILAAVKAKAYEVSRLLNEEEFKEIAESIIK
ncbi:MAG TPA: pyruvate carboxyltransferase [Sedimentibacter sp.]|nr:pyruvate carboxyltransferase [Sedimentibacter sp.]MBP8690737.1 pyruvate carboxyltransferase [Sedimentibacter sp.]HOK48934.1 pyruvate carboxyltransferase [Sedimentibacter sp.]HOW23407.1 pyruvate carboxyltransferase [Sedimentibacter sp.]HOW23409.1 pyruvate carboxyltransferase [Sedimentibacter sp.]